MDTITSAQILDKAQCLNDQKAENKYQKSYNKSYFHFVNFFSEKEKITEQDLVIGANFAYGWMPTILNFKSDKFQEAIAILNKAKNTERISTDELELLRKLINNSLVGTSKLLHFINPDVYAIWDSRVCHFLTGKSHKQKVEKIALFWSYLDLCERVSQSQQFEEIHNSFIKTIGYTVTPMRTLEQIMFISSNNPIVQN